MKKSILAMVSLLIIFFCSPSPIGAKMSLQDQINVTPSGGTLQLEDHVYEESIILSKPITIKGTEGTILSQCSGDPVITIRGSDVTVKNIKIVSCSEKEEATALWLEGSGHLLKDLTIDTSLFGIVLDHANNSIIDSVHVVGNGQENGIDLWNSSNNVIQNASIEKVQDGIYLENSHHNTITKNIVRESRYGFHFMFSDYTQLIGNQSTNNNTGAMIMGTKESLIEDNQLLDNNLHVHSQGLLIYDSIDAKIINNTISGNRVGMFMDHANQNLVDHNLFSQNFIGIQLRESHQNSLENNNLIGNVHDSQAIKSQDNYIKQNYWDLSLKLDNKGDGISRIPYKSDPYFLLLTSQTPEFQIFFHSPGMLVLQTLLKSEESALLIDEYPRMVPTMEQDQVISSEGINWLVAMGMLSISSIFFLKGRKQG